MVDFPLQNLFPTNHLQTLRAPHEDVGAGSSTLLAAVDLLEGTWLRHSSRGCGIHPVPPMETSINQRGKLGRPKNDRDIRDMIYWYTMLPWYTQS